MSDYYNKEGSLEPEHEASDPMEAWDNINISQGDVQCPYSYKYSPFSDTKLCCRYREGHPGLHRDVYIYPAKEDQSGWFLDEERVERVSKGNRPHRNPVFQKQECPSCKRECIADITSRYAFMCEDCAVEPERVCEVAAQLYQEVERLKAALVVAMGNAFTGQTWAAIEKSPIISRLSSNSNPPPTGGITNE